jgi:serine protease AprX
MRRLPALLAGTALLAGLAAVPAPSGVPAPAAAVTTTATALTAPDSYVLPFAAGAVDPATLPATDPADRDIVLVQFARRGDTAGVHATADTGATMVQPLAPSSYLVWADAAQTAAIRALPAVRWAGVLPAHLRVADSVTADTTLLRVTVLGDGGDLAGLAQQVSPRAFTRTTGVALVLPGDAALAATLAARPEVYSVAGIGDRPALRDERTNLIIADDVRAPVPGTRFDVKERYGVDGSGVRVAVIDGGVDANHPELSGRDITCESYTPVPGGIDCTAGNSDDAIGHGTFVAGVVMGDGSTGIGDGGPTSGFRYGQGVAPGADLHVQNAINLTGIFSLPDIADLMAESARSGAVISQNSWGPSSTPQGYDEQTRQADVAVRDADPDAAGDQPLNVVFSIMNGSGGTSTQGAPDEAKNIVAVGGTGSGRQGSSTTGDDLCTCSAHGPNLDGRRLVDIVAPGQVVASTRAAQGTLCGIPPAEFRSPLHGTCTGTSFASPHVSGAIALFVERHRDLFGSDPSPALVKAALVNTASDLSTRGGRDANGKPLTPVPNEQQGWGRLNLGRLMGSWTADAPLATIDQDVVFTATGERATTAVEAAGGAPLRVTLAWTDAPGHGQGGDLPAWVNDLDLVVTSPSGVTYRGNVFAQGRSVTGGAADGRNNLENVWLPTAESGTWTIEVRASAIVGDALPNSPGLTEQDFALVVTGARAAG